MNLSLRLAALFGLLAVAQIVGLSFNRSIADRNAALVTELDANRRAGYLCEGALSTLKDAETGQRGYLLTGDVAYLLPYEQAKIRLDRQLGQLRTVLSGVNGASPDELANLNRLFAGKMAELAETIQARSAGDGQRALAIVESGRGKALMEEARAEVDRLEAKAGERAERVRTLTAQGDGEQTVVFGLTIFADLLFLGWAFTRIRREARASAAAALAVARERDLLAVTLRSIGDAVIITDPEARVTSLNDTAERLTGWTAEAAVGQDCATVFRIINEETRQPVESPVSKVLALGGVVGLANHTLLITREGQEIPIDDSGAPIRDREGSVRGVVLVFRDFSEHKAAERQLRQANEELAAAGRAKDQFLATVSHELRTPLTPVLAILADWESDPSLATDRRAEVGMMRRNIELEARLIDDLMDFNRVVQGKLPLASEVLDAHELIRSVAFMYRSEFAREKADLQLELSAERPVVNVDPGRFQQVLWNLFRNALKFSGAGQTVRVTSVNDAEGNLSITVEDQGIGMSSETLSRIFQPFEQGPDLSGQRAAGLGLGLSISKAILTLQGGRLCATSRGVGQGSAFTVTLPALEEDELRDARKELHRAPAASRTGNGDGHEPAANGLRILLVEDHQDTAAVLTRLLRHLGHRVDAVTSVDAAAAALRSDPPDVLLSDVGLPDGTGLDVVRAARQAGVTNCIALTGFGTNRDIASYREAGFTAHLIKPIDFAKLREMVARGGRREAGRAKT